MNAIHLESALRILLAHRNSRPWCALTRRAIRATVRAIRKARERKREEETLRGPLE